MSLDNGGASGAPAVPPHEPPETDAVHAVYASEDFQRLSRERGRLAWWLTGVTLAVYLGFFLWVALGPGSLSTPLSVVGSSGLLAYLVLTAVAFALVAVYLRVTTRRIVPLQDAVAADAAERLAAGDGGGAHRAEGSDT
ncbi:DUF485 domain-containing protein [Streptomyces sp. NPDC050560]|uniref:DUF485 domain-containing protein n=1 Tax=Streptomyces sp. NPDC050560 TaxID=3365630 RepID=UPI00379E07BA